jgi:hypothetical protein
VIPDVVLAVQDKLTLWTGAAVPLPLRAAELGELEALLLNDADAEAVPVAPGVNFTVKVTGWLVVTVTGKESPLIENSEAFAPLKLTEETDTLPPVALSVPVWVPLVPTVTLPTLTGVTLRVAALCAVADPLKGIVRLGFEAFEAIATLPVKLPADCGAKVTLKDALCPGVKVKGVEIPEMLHPAPETEACEMVPFEPPTFFTVSVCTWFWPTWTFVNVRLVGDALKVAGVTPVPETAKSTVVLDPSIVSDRLPLTEPAVVGAKTTPNVVLWLGASVSGRLSPE